MTRLKDRTLQKAYQKKALREGQELLVEADQKKIQQIQQALEYLDGITPDEARIFDEAIEKAKEELASYLRGGIKQSVKNVFSDPVAKSTTLANAIRNGLMQLPTIARLYLPKGTEKETQKSIWELVPPEKQQAMLTTFTKSFKSDLEKSGLGSAMELLKGNGLPYVANLSAAVQELLQNVNPQGGFKMGQQASAQKEPPVETSAPAQGQGQSNAKQTQGPQTAQTTTATQPTQQTQPGQKPVETKVPKKVNPQDQDHLNDIADFLTNPQRKNSPKLGVDAKTVTQVLAALAKNGMLVA